MNKNKGPEKHPLYEMFEGLIGEEIKSIIIDDTYIEDVTIIELYNEYVVVGKRSIYTYSDRKEEWYDEYMVPLDNIKYVWLKRVGGRMNE